MLGASKCKHIIGYLWWHCTHGEPPKMKHVPSP